jgi:hypothetical protein
VSDDDDRHARADDHPATALRSADPPRNFTLGVDERIRALTIGAPAYALRKRKIEDKEELWVRTLVALHDTLAANGCSEAEIAAALEKKAASFDYVKQNALVTTHNRWYPVEANLRIDPRTGGYLVYGRSWHEERTYAAERMLELAARARARISAG